jgi:5-methylthioadenosine/S-adenosylhomocysteine deaminase
MIRFYNGLTLTFKNGINITDDEVWINGETIEYVGPMRTNHNQFQFEKEIDLNGNLLMPSFKNAHTHSAMTFLRSYADDMPLNEWLNNRVFPMEAKLTPELVYYMTKIAIMEYLTSGITASFDMYFYNDAYVQANIDSGFRTVICSALNNFDKDPSNVEKEYIKFNQLSSLIGYQLGIHAEYTTGIERMRYMKTLIEKYHAPFYAHCSETEREVKECYGRWGKSPVELFEDLGLFDYGGGIFHGVWLSENDIRILKEHNIYVVTNPSSNLKLASGIAPICKLMNAGVPLAIGTDGAASNNALDMFREMYLTTALQKYLTQDASACDADEVLKMACVGGAEVMGLSDCFDIDVGQKADMIVIDMHNPNMQPVHNISKNIVYAGSKSNVKMTIVNGSIRYDNGKYYIGEEPSAIFLKAKQLMKEIYE